MVQDNQMRLQGQAEYLKRFEKAEAAFQRTQAKKEALEAEISQRVSRRRTILAAYDQLLDSGAALDFESRQFNALIDHATVTADAIRFAFKSGHEIEVGIG